MSIPFSRVARVLGLIAIAVAMAGRGYAATALTACQTISVADNYTLSNDITTSGDCFVVTVTNVAIDFKKHKLTGDGTGSGITDAGNVARNLVVINGTISNFNRGIYLSNGGSYSVAIDHMTVSGNTHEGILIASDDDSLTNVVADNNGADGIHVGDCCDTFSNIEANNNTGNGVFAAQCCSLAADITAKNNGGNGIQLDDCCSAFDNVVTTGNHGIGMYGSEPKVDGGCCNLVSESVSTGNTGDGTQQTGCCNLVNRTNSSSNGGDGFLGTGCCNLATNSQFNSNGNDGVEFVDDGGDTGDDDIVSSVVANNNQIGVALLCPSNTVRLKANGNPGGNLHEDTGHGQCTDVNNNAP